jgi:hypothetical protein
MNVKYLIIVAFASILIGCAVPPKATTGPAGTPAHSFGIYLLASTADKPSSAAASGDLAALPLAKEPVLSDADILSYDFANHTMLVTREALSRLPKPSVWHMPFVVVADEQRIYMGQFSTILSSSGSSSVPTILVDTAPFTNSLTIYSGYPPPGVVTDPDPRSDERIWLALAMLQKLK